MNHFITEATLFHYAHEALNSGVSRNDLVQLVGSELLTKRPSLTTKIYIDKLYPLLRVLHEAGYQTKQELAQENKTYAENDIHHAYFSNTRDMDTLLKQYIAMTRHHTSSLNTEIQTNGKVTTLFIDFFDNKAGFFVPQNFHAMLIMQASRIFELTQDQRKKIVCGFTQHQLPDENNFSRLATSRIRTNEERSYIQFPTEVIELKNKHHNPLITAYLTQQYRQNYGLDNNEDALLTTISSHLSASWMYGNMATNIDDIAGKLGMSRSKLYRELTQRNITFSSIVESQRKHYAMTHIKDRETSIAEISERLGYANVSAFTRAFNRWFNVNPSKMRQQ